MRLPAAQNTPESVGGMMQRKQGCQIVCSSHAPAGAVVLHPAPNNGEDIALHTPAAGGLLALVGQRRLPSCSLVVRYQGMTVVDENSLRRFSSTSIFRIQLIENQKFD